MIMTAALLTHEAQTSRRNAKESGGKDVNDGCEERAAVQVCVDSDG